MSSSISRRAASISPFLAMEVMERAQALQAAGRDIIYLCLGEPDLPTPAPIVDTAIAAINDGQTRYTPSLGDRTIRQAIADYYQKRYQTTVDPDCILVSAGTSPLMLLLFAMLLDIPVLICCFGWMLTWFVIVLCHTPF